MKKNIKNSRTWLVLILILFVLTGCGQKNIDPDLSNIINQTGNDNQKTVENNNTNEYNALELYSDDNKIVFNMEDLYYIVFYHNGNNIIGLEYIYDYQDLETAKFFETSLKKSYEANDNVEKVELKGTQLRIKFKESVYKGQTLESVKQTYSYLKEVKGN